MAANDEYRDKVIEDMGKHLATLNDEMGGTQRDMAVIKIDVAAIKVDLGWVRKIAWWQLGLLGSMLVASACYIAFG